MSEDVVLNVDPGACRFKGTVTCHFDGDKVSVRLECGCPYVRKLGESLREVSVEEIIHMPFGENKVYIHGGRTLKHSVCPYPMSILKCAESSAGFALKKDMHMEYGKGP